jgi:hypothetical protein
MTYVVTLFENGRDYQRYVRFLDKAFRPSVTPPTRMFQNDVLKSKNQARANLILKVNFNTCSFEGPIPLFLNITDKNRTNTSFKVIFIALTVWHSGHRVRLQNRRSRIRFRVRILPGCKVFRNLYIAVLCS